MVRVTGAGGPTRLGASGVLVLFLMWACVDMLNGVYLTDLYSQTEIYAITIIIMACAFFAYMMSKSKVDLLIVKMMGPIIFLKCANSVVLKMMFNATISPSAAFYHVFIQTIATLVVLSPKMKAIAADKSDHKTLMMVCPVIALIAVTAMLFKNSAISLSPNPAYIAAIMSLTPIWITVLNKLMGNKDKANIPMGVGLVFSVIALIYVTGF